VEAYRHVVNVGKDGTLGAFTEDKRGRKRDFFAESKGRVILSKDSKNTMEQLPSLVSPISLKTGAGNVPLRKCNLGRS